jgi:hypothetical protein
LCDGFVTQLEKLKPKPKTHQTMYIDSLIADLERRLSFLVRGKYWLWKVTVISVFLFIIIDFTGNLSKLVYFRSFINDYVKQGKLDTAHSIIKAQSEDYFGFFTKGNETGITSNQHEAKMKFRLFLPTLVRIVGAKHFEIWLYFLTFILGFFYIYLIAQIASNILGENTNRILVLLFVAGFTNLYAGGGSFVLDIVPYGDFFAFLFLLLSIYTRNPLLIFAFCQCAFWVDERALVNAIFVMLWWIFTPFNVNKFTLKLNPQLLAVFVSGVIYVAIRQYLTMYYQLQDATYAGEFITTFKENSKMLSLRIWAGFDGMWMLIVMGLIVLRREKQYQFLSILLGSLITSISFAFIAYDVNRGISYGFVVLLISLGICKNYLSEKELKYVLIVCFLVSILSPTLNKFRIVGGGQLM